MFYLKYRPQTFAQLDNEKVRETLGKALLENNFSHAYLFVGSRGTGKTSAARLLAKVVNCTQRKKGEEPCNKCDSCKAIAAGTSLDVIEIDAASNTGVDDIRDLRDKVKLAPTNSRYKVYIIDEVHMLSVSAFNALLKTLEEPPEHVIFVLATTDPHKLPETIVSRCLVYDFGKVSRKEVVQSLSRVAAGEGIKVSEEVLTAVAERAKGSFRDAQKLLEQLSMQSAKLDLECLDSLNLDNSKAITERLLQCLVRGQKKEALALVEDFSQNNSEKITDLIDNMLSRLRDILLFKNGVGEEKDSLEISDEKIDELVKDLIEAETLVKNCPVPQLPLELVVVEFCEAAKPEGSEGSQDLNVKVSDDPDPIEKSDDLKALQSGDQTVGQTGSTGLLDTWSKTLKELKKYNHNLVALLRASRPLETKGDFLTVEVFYKFHKERLEEKKNREILEKVVSGIMGKDLKVKFVLAAKKE